MPPAKPQKTTHPGRAQAAPEPEAPTRERLNLGCGTLLIAICILGLLGKFLPHASKQASLQQAAPKAPATRLARTPPASRPESAAAKPAVAREPPVSHPASSTLPPKKPTAMKPALEKPQLPRRSPEPAQETPAANRPVVFNNPWDHSVSQVEHYIKRGLYDASSFQVLEWGTVIEGKEGFSVRCTYKARNVLGVVATQTRTFLLNRKGEVYKVKD